MESNVLKIRFILEESVGNMILRSVAFLLILIPCISFGQGPVCSEAFEIDNPSNYCSRLGQFTNVAGDEGNTTFDTPDCWDNSDKDVWFRFIATATNAKITVTGNTGNDNTGGTLAFPQVALSEQGPGCRSIVPLDCASDRDERGIAIIQFLDLTIGDTYLIRVDGKDGTTGSFTLCVEEFLSFQDNDECVGAIELGVIGQEGFCSLENQYDNLEASESLGNDCIGAEFSHDVWFKFTPTNSALFFQLFGRSTDLPQNITNPGVGIYTGSCGSLTEIECNQVNLEILEIVTTNVPIGRPVYIRIDGQELGNFNFCIRSFPPIPSPESDCPEAVILCDKSSFIVPNLQSTGNIQNELTGPCVGFDQDSETGSVWYAWTCKDPGSLTFVLNPNNPQPEVEDLDWVLYELPNGYGDCDNRQALRCMLSGDNFGASDQENAPCRLATGLREGETDVNEEAGCNNGSNNFLAPLIMEAGKAYALIVNNYSSSGYGFSIEFGGSGTFEGADTDFSFELTTGEQIVTCDSEVIFQDESVSTGDPITEWNWNFGEDASEQFKSGQGPHNITFNSIGDKEFNLTVVTERGCEITESKIVTLEDCCLTQSTLKAEADVVSLICPGFMDGRIFAKALGGDCEEGMENYQYSKDGILFSDSPLLSDYPEGQHTIYVKDCKGCVRDVDVNIGVYPEILVDAGSYDEVELGEFLNLQGSITPPDANVDSIIWDPMIGTFECDTCLQTMFQPIMDQLYTLTIVDKNGCRFSNETFITTKDNENVYEPNIFTPGTGTDNSTYYFGSNIAVAEIESLRIYDRWGSLVFESFDMPLNEASAGWDGKINGKPASQGIYSYIAYVRFINNKVKPLEGTITLIR